MTRISVAALLALFALSVPAAGQSAVGGANQFHLIAANSNNSTLIAAGEHTVLSIQVAGINAAPAYLKLYDKSTAPTCGTDTPKKVIMIPAAATAANGAVNNVSTVAQFSAGLGICVVVGIADNDNTSVASANFNINIDWK